MKIKGIKIERLVTAINGQEAFDIVSNNQKIKQDSLKSKNENSSNI
jgi:hypothetical protein